MIKIEAAKRLRAVKPGFKLRTRRVSAGRETGEGAGALFYAEDTGRFLLLKRSMDSDDGGTWCSLGGGRDRLPSGEFESVPTTVRREAFEEGGFPMDAQCTLKFIDTFEHGDSFKFHNFIGMVPNEFTPELNDEHTAFQWAKWDDFPENMHSKMMEALNSKRGRLVLRRNCDVPF